MHIWVKIVDNLELGQAQGMENGKAIFHKTIFIAYRAFSQFAVL